MTEPAAHQAGLREVLLVGAIVVAMVLGAAFVTSLLPGLQQVVFGTPVAILVLIGGTGLVLWRITRGRPEA